jgi:hypothetical protein
MTDGPASLPPAFYAAPGVSRRQLRDWWLLLHPPYTLWHLSYVAIGACLAPTLDGGRLVVTLLAFFLAVGIGAHALDELHGRPLRTSIPSWLLAGAAAVSLGLAVLIGLLGITRVGFGLAIFIVAGVVLAVGYNLELVGGRLHNDATFAAAWGAFPFLTGYYAQASRLTLPALVGAGAAYGLSSAQRHLSTPARQLRRRVASVDGTMVMEDGHREPIDVVRLLSPLERALQAMAWSMVALAVALVLARTVTPL